MVISEILTFYRSDSSITITEDTRRVKEAWEMVYAHRKTFRDVKNKVNMIKHVRNMTHLGLREALHIVEDAWNAADSLFYDK